MAASLKTILIYTVLNTLLMFLSVGRMSFAAQEERIVISNIEPMEGPDPLLKGLSRAIRIAVDPTFSDEDMFGASGAAFLATVCANNCSCRDFREMFMRIKPTLEALRIKYVYFEGKGEAIWKKIRSSLDEGIPVTAWNLFGDSDDALLVGYDLQKDLAYGYGAQKAEKEYVQTSLSKWTSGPMYGFIIQRETHRELKSLPWIKKCLEGILRLAYRAPLEGG